MAGISTLTKFALWLAPFVVTFGSVYGSEPGEGRWSIRNADWINSSDSAAEIEQTRFGGFFSPFFGSLAVTNVPRSSTRAAAELPGPQQSLSASAPATRRRERLARAPDMLGDTFLPPVMLISSPANLLQGLQTNSQLAVAGGSGRSKISEHNKPLPVDRVYFGYNHFHIAVQRQVFNGFGDRVIQSDHVDRFTIGGERTIMNGDASFEVRLPLAAYPDLGTNLPVMGTGGRFQSHTGTIGNLSVIGKGLLINEDVFLHSFLQVDVGMSDNPLTVRNVTIPAPSTGIGEIANQTLIHWDTSTGMWLTRSDDDTGITGIAAIVEFHLTSAVSSASTLNGVVPTPNGPLNFGLQSPWGRFTATYITAGIHTEIAKDRTIRLAGVFPLRDGLNRFFDGELVVQFGGRY